MVIHELYIPKLDSPNKNIAKFTISSCQRGKDTKAPLFVSVEESAAVAEESNRSSPGGMEEGDSKPSHAGGGEVNQKFDKSEAPRRVSEANSSDCAAEKTSREIGESGPSPSETLNPVRVSEGGLESDYKESSEFLSEVPVEYSLQPLQSDEELKDEVKLVNEEPLKGINGQPAEAHIQNQLQVPEGPSELAMLPKSAKQSIPSILIPSVSKKEFQLIDGGNNLCQANQNSPDSKLSTAVTMVKTSDGYNWRKYGQKQVKNPEGFRSYYRCTFSNCHAKKVECCDRSNCVIETVYRSQHNHDPPQKVNCTRENRSPITVASINGTHETAHTGRGPNDSILSISSKESLVVSDQMPETKRQDSCGSDETTEINIKEEYVEGPEYKRRQVLRQKRNSTGELSSLPKPGKKPKYVVHAAGDVGISGDGYRWRKYGQKMVKGNSHPRNYYRCTSAGCPVRKHIERDVDNDSAVLITYKGVHNHDVPVPRKRHGLKSNPAAPVTAHSVESTKTEPCQSPTRQSVNKEGELTGEKLKLQGGEQSPESARTLLSIGFEIKPC